MLKESKPKQIVAIQPFFEKKNINKVFSFECKECYKAPNAKKLRYKIVLKIKEISFLIVLLSFLFSLDLTFFIQHFQNHAFG